MIYCDKAKKKTRSLYSFVIFNFIIISCLFLLFIFLFSFYFWFGLNLTCLLRAVRPRTKLLDQYCDDVMGYRSFISKLMNKIIFRFIAVRLGLANFDH